MSLRPLTDWSEGAAATTLATLWRTPSKLVCDHRTRTETVSRTYGSLCYMELRLHSRIDAHPAGDHSQSFTARCVRGVADHLPDDFLDCAAVTNLAGSSVIRCQERANCRSPVAAGVHASAGVHIHAGEPLRSSDL